VLTASSRAVLAAVRVLAQPSCSPARILIELAYLGDADVRPLRLTAWAAALAAHARPPPRCAARARLACCARGMAAPAAYIAWLAREQ